MMPTMGVRFGVVADSERECAEGLALLLRALGGGLVVQRPAQVGGPRWIARVMPAAPAGEGRGREG